MTLSPNTLARLKRAENQAASYQPNETVAKSIKDKSLVMLVAPTATGKSFLINEIVKQDTDFRVMPIFTTRDPRPDDDPRYFRILPHAETPLSQLLDDIDAKQVVQYAVHPTTKRIYGTTIEDYPGRFNLLATLSHAVAPLQKLPFASTHILGLVAEPTTWKQWFLTRYPQASDERTKRVKEAVSSLEWLIAHDRDIHWVVNYPQKAPDIATSIINKVKYNQPQHEPGSHVATEMLATAKALLA